MAGFLTSSSVSLTSGSKTINLTGSVNCSSVVSGTAVYINGELFEGVAGTASDPSGNSTITLRNTYTGTSITGGTLVAFNTIEGLRDAIQRARDLSAEFQSGIAEVDSNLVQLESFLTETAASIDLELPDGILTVEPYNYLRGRVATLESSQVELLRKDDNLAGLTNKPLSRLNLELGTSSVLDSGSANGVASLDINGKVPLSQINDSVLGQVEYKGLWNPSDNTPTLPITPTEKGHYYICSTTGTQFGITFATGDWIISSGTEWGKVDNTDAVSSVQGRTGNVVLTADDIDVYTKAESDSRYVTSEGGLLSPFGLVPVNGGVWASGQTFTAYNQYMIYNGEAYSPSPATTLPYAVGAVPDLGFVYQIKLNDHSKLSNLNAVGAHNASSINNSSGGTVQDFIDDNGVNDYSANNLISQMFKSSLNRHSWVFGGTGVMILGDSISHGAFSRNIFRNNWTSILKRAWNLENKSESYGFVSFWNSLGSGGTLSTDVHTVSSSGFSAQTGVNAATSPVGYYTQSVAEASSLTVTVPTFTSEARLCYMGGAGFGSVEVWRNDVLITTLDTSTTSTFTAADLTFRDNGRGECKFEFRTTSAATVRLCGMIYSGSSGKHIHNFSTSGRKLTEASDSALTQAIQGSSTLIMALGHNDAFSSGDEAYVSLFNAKIDLIIATCNAQRIPVIVPDFNWRSATTHPMRVALKRLAAETKGTYIPFPEWFKQGNVLFTNTADQTTTYNLFDDGSHPNVEGHRIIGETIAKAMGLSATSRDELLKFHDWWMPIKIPSGSTAINNSDLPAEISAVKRNGDMLNVRYSFKLAAGGSFPLGAYDIADSASMTALGVSFPQDFYKPAGFLTGSESYWSHFRCKSAQFGMSFRVSSGVFAIVIGNQIVNATFNY